MHCISRLKGSAIWQSADLHEMNVLKHGIQVVEGVDGSNVKIRREWNWIARLSAKIRSVAYRMVESYETARTQLSPEQVPPRPITSRL